MDTKKQIHEALYQEAVRLVNQIALSDNLTQLEEGKKFSALLGRRRAYAWKSNEKYRLNVPVFLDKQHKVHMMTYDTLDEIINDMLKVAFENQWRMVDVDFVEFLE